MAAPTRTTRGDTGARRIVAVLGAVAFTYAFEQTAVLPAIPTIEHALHTSATWSAWLLSGYLMVATVTTPVLGRLADVRGEARVLVVSLSIFFLGSVGAATLPGLPALIISRAAQGAGGAVLPLSFAIARRYLPEGQAKAVIAGITGTFGLGGVAGFATGGWMAQAVSWRSIFGVGAAAVAVVTVLFFVFVPREEGIGHGGVDRPGVLWLGGATLAVLVGLTEGSQVGWGSPLPVALFLAATGCGVAWVRSELHHVRPLVDLRVLRDRTVALVNVATVGLGWSRFTGLLLVPWLVSGPGHGRYGFAADATLTGLFMVPDGFGTMLGGPLAGVLGRRMRPGAVMAAGMTTLTGGALLVATGLASVPHVVGGAGLLGLGGGIATQASSAVTTAEVPEGTAAASSSLNSTVRRFSGGVGGQVSTVVLAATAAGAGAAGATAAGASASPSATGSVSGSPEGFVVVFVVAAALALVGAAASLAADRSRPTPRAASAARTADAG